MIRQPGFGEDGVFRIPVFMPAAFCRELCEAAQCVPAVPAEVVTAAGPVHDESVRRTNTAAAPDHLVEAFIKRLDDIRDRIAERFGCKLGEYESPQVLAYGRGDHFSPHIDAGDEPGLPAYVRNRAMSIVLFLNSPSIARREGTYGGGTLTFFNVMEGAIGRQCRVPIMGETGLLAAFPSNWLHCVTPVQHGRRWTLVTWIASARPH